jgi:hypothetical protein
MLCSRVNSGTFRILYCLQWLQHTEFDANDPDNANLIELQRLVGSKQVPVKSEAWLRTTNQNAVYFRPPGRAVLDRLVYYKRRWKATVVPQGAISKLASRTNFVGSQWADSGQQLVMALRIWMRRLCDREQLVHGMHSELMAAPAPR